MSKTRIKGVCFHWSASGERTTVEDIRRWHVDRNGWRDIGYHRIILNPFSDEFKGKPMPKAWGELVKLGRTLDNDLWIDGIETAAAARGFNRTHIMVCVVGGPKVALHPLQKKAIYQGAKILCTRYELEPKDVTGHNLLPKQLTACPGPEIISIIKAIRFNGFEHDDGPGGPVYG